MRPFSGESSPRRVCALFSGGKDSTYALHWALLKGFSFGCLITVKPRSEDSMMFHVPYVELTKLQAEALGLPQVFYEQGPESDLDALKRALTAAREAHGCTALVTGALSSDYQRLRISLVAEEQGLEVFNPLWRKNQEEYMRELVRQGFRFILTSLSAKGLDPGLLGRELGQEDVEAIISSSRVHGFNPAFEGGEAETLVVDAPLFRKEMRVEGYPVKVSEYNWVFNITRVELLEKRGAREWSR
ncbi:diphthine--ammonia ligase [Infirmifilum sp. NZ]|uniref:diphthine--ammonia ligase n=1 Tax=Infirmifilum sp. NZ TaxID=2926850 RepID=UPI0027AAA5D9|nr:diphthine--ammonia ligase [Infirmifilum sp. NZ]UNQ73022.1 diphthine--ammonia ligase [Infirmifilum sp. NZ]